MPTQRPQTHSITLHLTDEQQAQLLNAILTGGFKKAMAPFSVELIALRKKEPDAKNPAGPPGTPSTPPAP